MSSNHMVPCLHRKLTLCLRIIVPICINVGSGNHDMISWNHDMHHAMISWCVSWCGGIMFAPWQRIVCRKLTLCLQIIVQVLDQEIMIWYNDVLHDVISWCAPWCDIMMCIMSDVIEECIIHRCKAGSDYMDTADTAWCLVWFPQNILNYTNVGWIRY